MGAASESTIIRGEIVEEQEGREGRKRGERGEKEERECGKEEAGSGGVRMRRNGVGRREETRPGGDGNTR